MTVLHRVPAIAAVAALLCGCAATPPLAVIQSAVGAVTVTARADAVPPAVSAGTVTVPFDGIEEPSVLSELRSGNAAALLVQGRNGDCDARLLLVATGDEAPRVEKVGCREPWTLMDDLASTVTLRVGNPARIWTVRNGKISGPEADPPPPPPMAPTPRRPRRHKRFHAVHAAAAAKTPSAATMRVALPPHPTFDPASP